MLGEYDLQAELNDLWLENLALKQHIAELEDEIEHHKNFYSTYLPPCTDKQCLVEGCRNENRR